MKNSFVQIMNMRLHQVLPNYHLTTYSPGDGVTRYRLVTGENDYFGGSSVVTVLGRRNAEDLVNAFLAGYFSRGV